MRTRVQNRGNSLAVRIPRAFADEVGLTRETPVDLTVEDGRLVVAPVVLGVPTSEEMVARITPDNVHKEIDWGPAQGHEAW